MSSFTSCGTSPTRLRAGRKSVTTSWPRMAIEPSVMLVMPQVIEISVVLPAPFGPSSARISPASISRLTSETASRPDS